jgi:hypothetical protein
MSANDAEGLLLFGNGGVPPEGNLLECKKNLQQALSAQPFSQIHSLKGAKQVLDGVEMSVGGFYESKLIAS